MRRLATRGRVLRTVPGGVTVGPRTFPRSGHVVLDRLADRGSGARRGRAADHDASFRVLIAVAAVVAAVDRDVHLGLAFQLAAFVVAAGAGSASSGRSRCGTSSSRRRCAREPRRSSAASAIVLEEVTEHRGRIRIGGEEWSSRAYDESLVIPVGTKVDVMQIDGATALVYPRE